MDPDEALRLGRLAEQRASSFLWRRGWRIAARNWIGGGGELDIVASRWRTLLVVEVRRRITGGDALASVDRDKLTRTMRAAQALIRLHDLQVYRLRFDVIGIDHSGRLHRRCDVLYGGVIGD
jgi:putative endonuclease